MSIEGLSVGLASSGFSDSSSVEKPSGNDSLLAAVTAPQTSLANSAGRGVASDLTAVSNLGVASQLKSLGDSLQLASRFSSTALDQTVTNLLSLVSDNRVRDAFAKA